MTEATDPEASEPSPEEPARPTPSRRVLWLLLAPVIALSVAGTAADIFAAAVVKDHPLVQVFFSPRIRYMALAANQVDAVPFYTVAFIRLVLLDPVYYVLGHFYGDTALRWIERKMRDKDGMVKGIEKAFAKAAYPIVMVAPNQFVCVLAGASGMRPRVFVTLNVIGTVLRLLLIKQLAGLFEGPLDSLLDFITRYRWQIVAFSAVVFGLQFLTQRKSGSTEIESISKIQQDFEAAARDVEAERSRTDEGAS